VSGTVRLFDGNGNPLTVNINGATVAGAFPFDIPPRGIRFFSTDGQGAVAVGSVQVTSNIPIGGTILFAGSLGVAGVGGVQPLAKFLVPIESDSSRGVDTGVAVSNPTESSVDVTFILRNADGNPLSNGTAVVQLLPNGQLAKFPREIFEGRGIDFSSFRGTLEINSPVPINGMAIRVSPGQFSTLPVAAVN
ncbi:MAG: hypothetical protein HYX74_10655, partial [Acidobacteria bacterium]|nr:hypothetical protein [Acidobacteriota bacterium]